ncbi:importin subunit alpha [Kipferlia bialata]|uniref:Importin subunit alpha n=1 Tax=Kipferlia bialata TaxID=797122 RepID=A0A391NM12_9EUKA|nr:importin subunit alpha [Kipferlia bialata]|eukprot:g1767.t1
MVVPTTLAGIEAAVELVRSRVVEEVSKGFAQLRSALALPEPPLFIATTYPDILRKAVQFLDPSYAEDTRHEAVWFLTNVTSGQSEHVQAVCQAGAIPSLLDLIRDASISLGDHAVWCLANVAGDTVEYRDMLLTAGVIPLLVAFIAREGQIDSTIRTAVWCLSNITRGRPPVPYELVRSLIVPVCDLLKNTQSEDIMLECVWTLQHVTALDRKDNQQLIDIMATGVVPRLKEVCVCSDAVAARAALRTIGTLTLGDESLVDALVELHTFDMLGHVITTAHSVLVRKEALWALSNLVVGKLSHKKAFFEAGLGPVAIKMLECTHRDTVQEAVFVVSNCLLAGPSFVADEFLSIQAIPALVTSLRTLTVGNQQSVEDAIVMALDAVIALLERGEGMGQDDNPVALEVERCGGLDLIEAMQESPLHDIYLKTNLIIDSFFMDDLLS